MEESYATRQQRLVNFTALEYDISLEQAMSLNLHIQLYVSMCLEKPAFMEHVPVMLSALLQGIAGKDKALEGRLIRAGKYLSNEIFKEAYSA